MTVADPPDAPADRRWWVNDAAVPGRTLVESEGIRRGMWTVSWLRQLVSAAAPDLVDPHDVEAWLEAGAREVPPGCGGLLTVPDWLAPPDAPHRRGVVARARRLPRAAPPAPVGPGGDRDDDAAATSRRWSHALGLAPGRLVVSGGGARSDLMTQLVADVFGRTAWRPAVADAAGLGAAVCAAVGHGTHPSLRGRGRGDDPPRRPVRARPGRARGVRRAGRGLRRASRSPPTRCCAGWRTWPTDRPLWPRDHRLRTLGISPGTCPPSAGTASSPSECEFSWSR